MRVACYLSLRVACFLLLGSSVTHCYPTVSLLLGVIVTEKSCKFMAIDFHYQQQNKDVMDKLEICYFMHFIDADLADPFLLQYFRELKWVKQIWY